MKSWTVVQTKRAQKDIQRAPLRIQEAFQVWVDAVENEGLIEVRKRPGFHDEPLHGDRKGQRSVRLNRQWRAIYRELDGGAFVVVKVEEVTPHAY